MNYEKKYKHNDFAKRLQIIDEKVGDFEEIPKVTIEDEDDEVYDLDMRCTDWGEAMNFFG